MQQIIQDIVNYIASHGGQYSDWYVGITSDINQRLFSDHSVNKTLDNWIYRTTNLSSEARNIEQYFQNLGCDGDTGGGDQTSRIIYAYKKTSLTKQ